MSMPDFINKLIADFGTDTILTGKSISDRASSFWDATPISAKALIKPISVEQLSIILKRCNEAGQKIVTHGGRTGCAEGANTASDHVIISTERLNKIEEIDEIGCTITVQAGAILQSVQEKVADKGLYFPLDLGARGSCTIGGNAATNAGGINVIRYGMMRNQILGLEAVLADGTIISSMNKMIKNNTGYDLKQLFIGSEGTLGIITRVVVKLEMAQTLCGTTLVGLNSFSNVIKFLMHMKKSMGSRLTAYEVMWGNYYRALTLPSGHKSPMSRDHPYYVITECSGSDSHHDAEKNTQTLEHAFTQNLIVDAIIAKSEKERQEIWNIREGFEAILENKPIFLYDISLPIKDMEPYIDEVQSQLKAIWPKANCYILGHIGDGNLHLMVCPMHGDNSLYEQSNELVYAPLKKYGGSISAEHGIGIAKKEWLSCSRTHAEITLMKALKNTLDPKNTLNPDVLFE